MDKLTENDRDAMPLVRSARTLAGWWPLVAGVCALITFVATVAANVKANTARIDQVEIKYDGGNRSIDERLRRMEESIATLLERTKGK